MENNELEVDNLKLAIISLMDIIKRSSPLVYKSLAPQIESLIEGIPTIEYREIDTSGPIPVNVEGINLQAKLDLCKKMVSYWKSAAMTTEVRMYQADEDYEKKTLPEFWKTHKVNRKGDIVIK